MILVLFLNRLILLGMLVRIRRGGVLIRCRENLLCMVRFWWMRGCGVLTIIGVRCLLTRLGGLGSRRFG